MIIIKCEQGTEEWFQARLGIPTASEFSKIITPAKMEPSRSADGYIDKLVGEWLTGEPDESFQSDWMKRGHDTEQEGRDFYTFHTGVDVMQVGFCMEDAKKWGCSPDGLVGEDGGVEIKCPSPGIHVGYLKGNKVPTAYKLQVLGSLLITGREWWDFVSYHPKAPALIIRTLAADKREDLAKLQTALVATNKKIYDSKKILNDLGYFPKEKTE